MAEYSSDSWVNANEAPIVHRKPDGPRLHVDMAKAQEETKKYMKDRYGKDADIPQRFWDEHEAKRGHFVYAPRANDLNYGPDMINNPPHYAEGRMYEPKDVIRDWGLNFNLGSATKYLSRSGRKENAIEDLQKAVAYIQFEIDALHDEGDTTDD